jgi:hypothetical protein
MPWPHEAFQTIAWREGTYTWLRERFAAVRVRHAGGNVGKARLHLEPRLLTSDRRTTMIAERGPLGRAAKAQPSRAAARASRSTGRVPM